MSFCRFAVFYLLSQSIAFSERLALLGAIKPPFFVPRVSRASNPIMQALDFHMGLNLYCLPIYLLLHNVRSRAVYCATCEPFMQSRFRLSTSKPSYPLYSILGYSCPHPHPFVYRDPGRLGRSIVQISTMLLVSTHTPNPHTTSCHRMPVFSDILFHLLTASATFSSSK